MTLYKLNLQLFAGEVQTTDRSELSPTMKTYYKTDLIELAEAKLVHDQFGTKKPIPPNEGKTIEFRMFDSLPKAMTPLTEGVTPDGNNLSMSSMTATVAQYGDYVRVSDVLDMTAVDPIIVQATKKLGSQAGRTLDTVTRDVITAGTNVIYAPKVGSGGATTEVTSRKDLDGTCKLTPDLIFRAVAELKAMDAEPFEDGYFVAIVHPYASYDLMRNEEWIDAHKYADPESIYKGEIGRLGQCRFVETTEAKVIAPVPILHGGITKLTVKTANSSANATVAVNEAITTKQVSYLSDNTKVYLNGTEYTVVSATEGAAGAASITLDTAVTCAVGDALYGVGGTSGGLSVFATMVLAQDAYGTTELENGGLEHFVKPRGYGDDPLNQRAACGWKATKVAKRLVEQYMVRVEHTTSFSGGAESN